MPNRIMPPASGPASRIVDGMAEAAQMIGGGEARRPRADDEDALARFALRLVEGPAPGDGDVAEEPLDRIDADRLVDLSAVARGFAGVVADAAHDGGQRIVCGERPPGVLVVAGLGMGEPALNVLAGRAGGVAGRQAVDIDRPLGAPRAGMVELARADVERDGVGVFHQCLASAASSSP